ncbi:hypothetical protein HOU35_gp041 [Acinetobacter phage vB_AbaM_B09_Aci05]|uniref:Uncharacterized protein n=1 Tax=Acinetobacter phage vB_AbaM_B09_Aci05 TaxID=2315458 RepID=A0A386KE33_9CAUD|nr:hypothetical protein HOU35_gp041 [Acinetobacter phage vB_AbaM_B09_Aci05]AYD82460.1 hypothetical protein Aci05_136 [Acinetobacter phage vB_AbaM_B09_Aci05]
MKVFILMGCLDHEEDCLISVHASKEGAELAGMEHESYNKGSFSDYLVLEREVLE